MASSPSASNQDKQDANSRTNPKRGQNPNPRPCNNVAQFKDNKSNREKFAESGANASIVFIIFHFSFLSGLGSFPSPFLYDKSISYLE